MGLIILPQVSELEERELKHFAEEYKDLSGLTTERTMFDLSFETSLYNAWKTCFSRYIGMSLLRLVL